MWANNEELGLNEDSKLFFENDGILFFDQKNLEDIPNKIEMAETSFLKVGKKIYDITGYTTGVGLGVKEVFGMMKKKNAIKFPSDFYIEGNSECLKTLTDDLLKAYPCEYLDKLSSKLFFSFSEEQQSKVEAKKIENPYCELEQKKVYYFHIHFIK